MTAFFSGKRLRRAPKFSLCRKNPGDVHSGHCICPSLSLFLSHTHKHTHTHTHTHSYTHTHTHRQTHTHTHTLTHTHTHTHRQNNAVLVEMKCLPHVAEACGAWFLRGIRTALSFSCCLHLTDNIEFPLRGGRNASQWVPHTALTHARTHTHTNTHTHTHT